MAQELDRKIWALHVDASAEIVSVSDRYVEERGTSESEVDAEVRDERGQ